MALKKKTEEQAVAPKTEIVEIQEITVSPKDGTITDKNGVVYTLSELVPSLKPTDFQNGKSYGVEILKGKGGSLYIQKVLGELAVKHEPVESPKTMTKREYWDKVKKTFEQWAKEDNSREIGERGLLQAATIAASNFSINVEDLEKNVRLTLMVMDKLLAERNV